MGMMLRLVLGTLLLLSVYDTVFMGSHVDTVGDDTESYKQQLVDVKDVRELLLDMKCNMTGPVCYTSCEDASDGLHQYCGNCSTYLVCTQGQTQMGTCPGDWVFDQNDRGCRETSTSCIECYEVPKCMSTGPMCFRNCIGLPNGDYQSCENCVTYLSCSYEETDVRLCPVGTLWDDNLRGCVQSSNTCLHCATPNLCANTGEACIWNCRNQVNGFYQSCVNCSSYIQCTNGSTTFLPCSPAGWHWGDHSKACIPLSYSCYECYGANGRCNSTGTRCIYDCYYQPNMYFQGCNNCSSYVQCQYGVYSVRHCPLTQWWDDNLKRCDYESNTCQECYLD